MNRPELSKRSWIMIISIAVVALMVLASVLFLHSIVPRVGLGRIEIFIEDDSCNVTATLTFDPDITTSDEELDLVLTNSTAPIGYSGNEASISLAEDQFREIMEKEEIRIKGELDARPLPLWTTRREIDERIDLTFISDLMDSLEISNIDIERPPGDVLLMNFDLEADIEKDVTITIKNTTAVMRTGEDFRDVLIRDLYINNNEPGRGSVELDASVLLAAAINSDDLGIDAWGINVDFELPIDI